MGGRTKYVWEEAPTPRVVSQPPTPTIRESEQMALARRQRAGVVSTWRTQLQRQAQALGAGIRARPYVRGTTEHIQGLGTMGYVPGATGYMGMGMAAGPAMAQQDIWGGQTGDWRRLGQGATDWQQAALDWRQRSLQLAQQTTADIAAPKPLSKLAQAILDRAKILMGYEPYLMDQQPTTGGYPGGGGVAYPRYRGGGYGGGGYPRGGYYQAPGVGTGRISTRGTSRAAGYGMGLINWRI